MNRIQLIVVTLSSGLATVPLAAADECSSSFPGYDVISLARAIQQQSAPLLPMQLNSEWTATAIVAMGPKVMFVFKSKFRKDELSQQLQKYGVSMNEYLSNTYKEGRNYTCSSPATSAFVRCGGQIDKRYLDAEKYVIGFTSVKYCN